MAINGCTECAKVRRSATIMEDPSVLTALVDRAKSAQEQR
jgi:hypothetical protein